MSTPPTPQRIVDDMMRRDEFSRWLGIQVDQIGPGCCSCSMVVRPEMANGFGVAHGGIAFSLADSAFAFAANSHGQVSVALDNSISYPAPVKIGDRLKAVATERAKTNRTGYYDVEVTNQDGSAVALFHGTVYRTAKSHEE